MNDPVALDNPVWHALQGPRRAMGEHLGGAARFDPEVAPFGAMADAVTADSWTDLTTLAGESARAVLLRTPLDIPPPWRVHDSFTVVQMVATRAPSFVDDMGFAVVDLGPDDAEEMQALAASTRPGPFRARTVDFGGFVGVREGGALIAMGGERLRLPGATEISAVCTADAHRGRGLAGTLVARLVGRIQERGEDAFLHAEINNTNAIRLYEKLGFELRRTLTGLQLTHES